MKMRVFLLFIFVLLGGCAWYQGPELMPNANADLSGSELTETDGPGFISTLESADNHGGKYVDDSGNYNVTNFDNVT
ncbi:hypothetical protein [Allofrancisella frigidaquae]|uniref:Lipoprotein n=1 Tax=Allofrancisella frigidaquae TaxID=1085644 RepID=A0A6M3HSV8_9GAMM|nr:hypothetical protein [Allofrancisella frigidaquae]KEI34768.1 putative lipoprotein [Francisella sp. W12-1067]QIV94170.1 hypothetical protein E3E15_01875 [Allofrancisella frigidaquae]